VAGARVIRALGASIALRTGLGCNEGTQKLTAVVRARLCEAVGIPAPGEGCDRQKERQCGCCRRDPSCEKRSHLPLNIRTADDCSNLIDSSQRRANEDQVTQNDSIVVPAIPQYKDA